MSHQTHFAPINCFNNIVQLIVTEHFLYFNIWSLLWQLLSFKSNISVFRGIQAEQFYIMNI